MGAYKLSDRDASLSQKKNSSMIFQKIPVMLAGLYSY